MRDKYEPSAKPTSPAPTTTPAPGTNSPAIPGIPSDLGQILMGGAGGANSNDIWHSPAGNDLTVRTGIDPSVAGGKMLIADVMWRFYQWDDKRIQALAQKLTTAGFLPSASADRDTVWDAYRRVLMEAGQRYNADPTKAPTVEQILNKYMKSPVGDAGDTKPKNYTQISGQLSDPTQADELLTQTLTDRLGRAPTEAEKHGFLGALNAAQRSNPQKTGYTLDEKTGQYNESWTSGGVDTGGFTSSYVDDDPALKKEQGAYQMATTYFGALEQALGAVGG